MVSHGKRKRNRVKDRAYKIRYYHKHKNEKEFRILKAQQNRRYRETHPETKEQAIEHLIRIVNYIERKASDEEYESFRGLLDYLSAKSRKSKGFSELE